MHRFFFSSDVSIVDQYIRIARRSRSGRRMLTQIRRTRVCLFICLPTVRHTGRTVCKYFITTVGYRGQHPTVLRDR